LAKIAAICKRDNRKTLVEIFLNIQIRQKKPETSDLVHPPTNPCAARRIILNRLNEESEATIS